MTGTGTAVLVHVDATWNSSSHVIDPGLQHLLPVVLHVDLETTMYTSTYYYVIILVHSTYYYIEGTYFSMN